MCGPKKCAYKTLIARLCYGVRLFKLKLVITKELVPKKILKTVNTFGKHLCQILRNTGIQLSSYHL